MLKLMKRDKFDEFLMDVDDLWSKIGGEK